MRDLNGGEREAEGSGKWPLEEVRNHFAEELRWTRWLKAERVIAAFAAIPREEFLGQGPWKIFNPPDQYIETDNDDPRHIYHNVRIAIDPSRHLNNGEPGMTARVMEFVEPSEGEIVTHIGCGTGYFTAIWSHIVGPCGRVLGYEIDPELASAAIENLSPYQTVEVCCGDGMSSELNPSDIIVMSAGTNHIKKHWLDALKINGRLVFPFTTSERSGRILRVTRRENGFEATFVHDMPVSYYDLVGARDAIYDFRLEEAISEHGWEFDGSIHPACESPCEDCWLWMPEDGFCISKKKLA